VGAALFILLTGVVIALGGSALFAGVTFTSTAGITIRAVIGLLLIVLGVIQLGLIPVSFHGTETLTTPLLRRQAQLRKNHPMLAFGLFGFVYILAGFG
jgi:cytochrome c biogenesis protein CcdA